MNILNKISNFWRWHPEVAIRYLPIVNNLKSQKLKILEVGSGWLGISPYLGQEVTGLDKEFGGKKFYLLKRVEGDLLNISYAKNSFDAVISVDVLEHLPNQSRQKAIEEILRVAKKKVFLAIPCGKESLNQDKQLDKEYRQIFGKSFPYLQEHLKYGLPGKEELIKLINLAAKNQHKKIEIEVKGNENLLTRKFLMKGWMTKSFLIDILFRKVLLILTPLFILFDKPPYYRQMFFVTIKT